MRITKTKQDEQGNKKPAPKKAMQYNNPSPYVPQPDPRTLPPTLPPLAGGGTADA